MSDWYDNLFDTGRKIELKGSDGYYINFSCVNDGITFICHGLNGIL